MDHLWRVTSTESGLTKVREYRCDYCGAVTRDDDKDPAPVCVPRDVLTGEQITRTLSMVDGILVALLESARSSGDARGVAGIERIRRSVSTDPVFLVALEIAAEDWLKTVRFEDLYERGAVEAAALANVLQRWLATRGKGPLVR